jgi:G3E family GTPase
MDRPNRPVMPVTLLTGFLGAGKTTLLNRILRTEHGRRIAVVVNDVGAINIDERLVTTVHGGLVGLANGCMCCDLEGDLRRTMLTLLALPEPPDSIVVEASGIADPVASVQTFQISELRDRVRLEAIVTLVDAEHARDPRLDAQLVRDQIVVADIIVLNKVDLVSGEEMPALTCWLRSIAPQARILPAIQADVPLDLLLGSGDRSQRQREAEPHAAHRHLAFTTWSYQCDQPLDLHETLRTLKSLPPEIFRGKGILALADAPRLRFSIQMVGKRIATEILGPWNGERPRTELVFIGTHGQIDEVDLARRLDSCSTR